MYANRYGLVAGGLLLALAAASAWPDDAGRANDPFADEPAATFTPAFRPGGRPPFAIPGGMALPAGIVEQPEHHAAVTLAANGDLARRLERTQEELVRGNVADAVRQLGQWLQSRDAADFILVHDDVRRGGRSFRSEVRRLIGELSPTALAAYRLQFDAAARQALQAALAAGGVARLREVMLQFPRTTAGAEAAFRLGNELLDHGSPAEAAACLERLQADREVGEAFEPLLSLLLAACWQRAGRPERFAMVTDKVASHPGRMSLRVGGQALIEPADDRHARERLASLFGEASPREKSEGDWLVFRGDEARNRQVVASAPLLLPRWSVPLASDGASLVALEEAERALRQGRDAQTPLLHPLAVGELVFVRTATGVAAHDAGSGERLWHVPADGDESNAGIIGEVLREPAGGAFSLDGECVYCLAGLSSFDPPLAAAAGNILSAHEHSRGRQGNLRWRIGGRTGGDEPRLADARFLGSPLPRGDRLYAVIEQQQALHLAVLVARTGRLEWSQELALVDDNVEPDTLRQLAGATPSISHGDLAICPTSAGVVVAVDLTTRSLAWAYRYARQPSSTDTVRPSIPQHNVSKRWCDATATIAGDSVVLSPAESFELHCVDAGDGTLRWKQPREDGLFVAGITADAVVVVGRHTVRALKLDDGEPAWPSPFTLPAGVGPSGRGVSTRDRYFLPLTNAAIVEINLLDGRLNAQYRSPREVIPGNLIWHRGRFISQTALRLQAFDERAAVERSLDESLSSNPNDCSAVLRRGELALATGRLDDALADFRDAYRIDHSGKARSRLISALLDTLRQERDGRKRAELEDELTRVGE